SEPTPINTDPLQQPYVMGWVGHTVLYSQYILMSSEAEIYASTVSNGVPDEPVLVSSDGGEGTAGGVLSPDKRSLIYSRIPEAGPATVYFVEDVLEPLPVALTGPNLTGRSSLGFHWSPDSSRIVIVSMPFPEESPRQTYILDTERLDLGAVRLNTNLPEGGSTWRSGS